ncbi:hypothetical protein Trco_001404 [Trichoderma cornu-damae]|uniref:DUF6604 domain-containing protein n=1 Tax=Trichoderma cornu-damae TaxID=654480 RepID=A0A9P8QU93_9HYPO|nr:hypothetical protein Trco_001404 [Trichoderma cornu-damae]
MKFNNFYVLYKRDTRLLLYWMVKTSNAIIKSLEESGDEISLELNITGQVTVSDLVAMSELIAKHHVSIPSPIYHLFQSVIELRSIYYAQFQQLATVSPSEELEKSNSTHKYFIDALSNAFVRLGGEAWLSKEHRKQAKSEQEGNASKPFAFSNKFSVLDLDNDSENDDALGDAHSEESDGDPSYAAAPQKKRWKQASKRRKKGKGKKLQRERKAAQADDRTLEDVPLESYRIIEDDGMTEYVMAALALTRDWIQLRSFLQDIWRRVAYQSLNSAVAATLSNIAVAMIKQSEATIFIDFPGYESYEMIMQTITRGDVEKAQSEFRLTIRKPGTARPSGTTEISLDVKELFLVHTYQDLVDFIKDYQKTRSGKPTRRMLAQIDNWDPNFNLREATKEERIEWRRSYTINWLYDLVNVTAGVAIHAKAVKGESYVFEQMDWSNNGPLKAYRRMFGLIDFAAEVTTLAMQRPGADFRHRIPPHLVFHLQCIMDAWAVSRGWAISGTKGHILSEPAESFQPRHDLEIFLGRDSLPSGGGDGFLRGTYTLKAIYLRSKSSCKSFEHTLDCIEILEKLGFEFLDALGKCKLFHDLAAMLPSRFSTTNSNGVWDYSPFLCGAGLAEALELMYRSIMLLWDGMREPMLVLHLHNMLVQRGYLKKPVTLYSRLGIMFADSFFAGGQPPTDRFVEAFHAHVNKIMTRKEFLLERSNRRAARRVTHTREFLKLVILRLFKQKSNLLLYRSADWDPDRIPDSDVDPMSALGMIRLSQTRRISDPGASTWRLEETELVKRTRAAGIDELFVTALDPFFERLKDERETQMAQMTLSIADCSSTQLSWLRSANKASNRPSGHEVKDFEMTAEMMLNILYNDIHGDICGSLRPLSSLNYLLITIHMLQYFEEVETQAENSGSSVLKALYACDESCQKSCCLQGDRKLLILLRTLSGKDRELMRTMAKSFEKCGGRYTDFIYWAVEDDDSKGTRAALRLGKRQGPVVDSGGPDCCLM